MKCRYNNIQKRLPQTFDKFAQDQSFKSPILHCFTMTVIQWEKVNVLSIGKPDPFKFVSSNYFLKSGML